MRPTARRAFPAALLLLASTGCYDYLALGAAPTPEALPVRVTLAPGGTARVESAFGPYIVTLDGTLAGPWPADSMRLVVFATYHQAGDRSDIQGVPVTLAAGDVAMARHRKLNVIKTSVLAIAAGAALAALPNAIRNAGGGGGTAGPPPTTQP